jgi:hypothetical protein
MWRPSLRASWLAEVWFTSIEIDRLDKEQFVCVFVSANDIANEAFHDDLLCVVYYAKAIKAAVSSQHYSMETYL